jgi:glycerophosphoryl diester phosphodiesterase
MAVNLGATSIELDVNVSSDSRLVIYHDAALNPEICRMRDGRRPQHPYKLIHQLPLNELKKIDVGYLNMHSDYGRCFPNQQRFDGERIPTLRDLSRLLSRLSANQLLLNIEVKSNPFYPDWSPSPVEFSTLLLNELDEINFLDRVWVQSFDWRVLQAIQNSCPNIPTGYLTSTNVNLDRKTDAFHHSNWLAGYDSSKFGGNIRLAIAEAGGKYWGPDYIELSEVDIEHAHQLGLEVHAWTANNPQHIKRLYKWKVDGITSDYPDRIRDTIEQ